ncbi:MAG: hypothetical protein A2W91_07850 [Bacteroidetes bacterium GWF2_38_335]|nr:MAG: hypothetical protein A2W91_07850 [Bacteroidetes bacterium GWF2_38_335]OFY79035.1 MAG: hypothetical protein A2281_02870 [Bacteroidetes bacterium RIFOXYA12_FULL_38_20]HBS86115.1 hypothetical protein [Bacteroidales bacterium]
MTPTSHHIDLTYLKNMSGENNELIIEMINIYKAQIPEFIEIMKKGVDDTDWEALASIAHKAKSSVAIMGISYLSEALKEMEVRAKAKTDLETIIMYVADFERICLQSIVELDEAVKNLK